MMQDHCTVAMIKVKFGSILSLFTLINARLWVYSRPIQFQYLKNSLKANAHPILTSFRLLNFRLTFLLSYIKSDDVISHSFCATLHLCQCKPGGFLKPRVCGFDGVGLQTRVPGFNYVSPAVSLQLVVTCQRQTCDP